VLVLASHDPLDHVLPHAFFRLWPGNLNFGLDQIPLLGFPLSKEFYFTNQLLMTLVAAGLCLLIFPRLARAYVATEAGLPPTPRGSVMNLLEALVEFIRKAVAQPVLKERTDRFMPFLWTLFFFILFCNLLGLVPLADIIRLVSGGRVQGVGGTATGNIAITGGLAICAFFMFHVSGVREVYAGLVSGTYGHHGHEEGESGEGHAAHGPAEPAAKVPPGRAALLALPTYLWSFAPHVFAKPGPRPKPHSAWRPLMVIVGVVVVGAVMAAFFGLLAGPAGVRVGVWAGGLIGFMVAFCLPGLHWTDVVDLAMWTFLLVLETIGAVIKPFALMIRLFANMVAGHIVLASILLLIFASKSVVMGYTVGAISVVGCLAISCLELFVAFLQAYIFVFLSTLFLGMSVAPEH
jgi:F0F1-type ATP synthase membrane subunit a